MCRSYSTETIASENNSKYKLIKSLQVKKYRDKEQLMFIEGHRSIIDAINNGLLPVHIFATPRAFDSPLGSNLRSVLSQLPATTADIVSESLMKNLVDTVTHQGVCGAFRMPTQPSSLPPAASLIVICDSIKDPGNLGTIFRTSYGLGVDCILLTEGCCDPYSPKVIRSSMGTLLSPELPFILTTWELIPSLLGNNYQVLICDAAGVPYDDVNLAVPTVLVLGSEASGVSAEAMGSQLNAKLIKIPMERGDTNRLNSS
jgi:RNA methyltransferase, TrmH family